MRAIGEALAQLDNAEARARVVRWATDRFCHEAPAAVTPEPLAAPIAPVVLMYTQGVPPIAPITVLSCPMAASSQAVVSIPAASAPNGAGGAASGSNARLATDGPSAAPRAYDDDSSPIEPGDSEEQPAAPAVAFKAAAAPSKPPIHLMLQDLINQFRDLANESEWAPADP